MLRHQLEEHDAAVRSELPDDFRGRPGDVEPVGGGELGVQVPRGQEIPQALAWGVRTWTVAPETPIRSASDAWVTSCPFRTMTTSSASWEISDRPWLDTRTEPPLSA